jgi:hypothetical protein
MAPQRRRSRSATDEEEVTNSQRPAVKREPPAEKEPTEKEPAEDRTQGSIRTAREAVGAALAEVLELSTMQPESIVGVQRTKDGWSVSFEVVEDRRIPSSTDVLATYEATVDADGELISFRRIRRYSRGRGDSDGGPTR